MEEKEKATITAARDTVTKLANNSDLSKVEAKNIANNKPLLWKGMLDNDSDTFPLYGLPGWVQKYVDTLANGYDCPRDYIVPMLFSAVSTAVGKKVVMVDGNYSNMLNLWVAVVGKSGTNKSTPFKRLYKPIQTIEARKYDEYRMQQSAWEENKRKGDEPVFKQHLIADSTPEAKYKALSQNGSVTSFVDEISTAFSNFDRYNKSGEASQLLSLFDGDDIRINRKGEIPLIIPHPFYGFAGGVQPSVIAEVFGQKYFMTSGFNQRWLFVYPDRYMLTGLNEDIPNELETRYKDFIQSLMAWEADEVYLYLSDEAQEILQKSVKEIINKVNATENDYLSALYSKERIHADRLAALIHIIRSSELKATQKEIDGDSMRYAVDCMRWFEKSALKVYRTIKSGDEEDKNTGAEESLSQCTNADLIGEMIKRFDIKNYTAYAKILGVSRPYISKIVNKNKRLRSYGYGSTLSSEYQTDTDKTGVTCNDDDKELKENN